MAESIEFTIPNVIKDFVFDLHDSSRMSQRADEVSQTYEHRFKELTEKYFEKSAWPEAQLVAGECNNDEDFLLFYKEMRIRHMFLKLKPKLSDLINSWNVYTKLFEFILSSPKPDILLTTQWINDITQEFAYQFQGFCQYRTQLQHRNSEDIRTLEANRSVWDMKVVMKILTDLVKVGLSGDPAEKSLLFQFGTFASVELARLECLLGDYTSSLSALSPHSIGNRKGLIESLPACFASVYYHAGVSQLMLRRYVDAIDTFSSVALTVGATLKQEAKQKGPPSQLQKIVDKVLALLAISAVLAPGYRVGDQAREQVEARLVVDKLRKLESGDASYMSDVFEQTCPKFITGTVPDYSTTTNMNQEAFQQQVQGFAEEARQQLAVLQIRKSLRLYAAIDLAKLARMGKTSEAALMTSLLSYKHKVMQTQTQIVTPGAAPTIARVSTSDVNFMVQDQSVQVESTSSTSRKTTAVERWFVGGIKKNNDIRNDLRRQFARYGL